MDITNERNIQGTDSSLQDGDHTDGYFITLFAEQLTRPFEVLVHNGYEFSKLFCLCLNIFEIFI